MNEFYDPITLKPVKLPDKYRKGRVNQIDHYEKTSKIGEGSYGVVYRGKHIETGKVVAIKTVKLDSTNDEMPLNFLREINILMNFKHTNIINLIEVVCGYDLEEYFLVMDYCVNDLGRLIDSMTVYFVESQLKCIIKQMLEGVNFLHSSKIIHRDIKMSNLLITNGGVIKIADFGMSRFYSKILKKMTPDVVTLWYRAPEILFGFETQTFSVDIWSCGCIIGEFYERRPVFSGRNEMEQIGKMIDLLGTPTKEIWPELYTLPHLAKYELRNQPYNTMTDSFAEISKSAYRMLTSIFVYDPSKRPTIEELLSSNYFNIEPIPCDPDQIPVLTFSESSDSSLSE